MTSQPGQEYLGRVRDELATLEAELSDDRVRERLGAVVQALRIPEELGLAAIYRAARRSGLSLSQFLSELERAVGIGQ